jgi:hypothetical protein
MAKLNRTVSKLITTTVVFSAAAGGCLYLAVHSSAAARALWAVIAALVAILGALMFELYRGRRT